MVLAFPFHVSLSKTKLPSRINLPQCWRAKLSQPSVCISNNTSSDQKERRKELLTQFLEMLIQSEDVPGRPYTSGWEKKQRLGTRFLGTVSLPSQPARSLPSPQCRAAISPLQKSSPPTMPTGSDLVIVYCFKEKLAKTKLVGGLFHLMEYSPSWRMSEQELTAEIEAEAMEQYCLLVCFLLHKPGHVWDGTMYWSLIKKMPPQT